LFFETKVTDQATLQMLLEYVVHDPQIHALRERGNCTFWKYCPYFKKKKVFIVQWLEWGLQL